MDPADITKKPQCADSVNITKNNQHRKCKIFCVNLLD